MSTSLKIQIVSGTWWWDTINGRLVLIVHLEERELTYFHGDNLHHRQLLHHNEQEHCREHDEYYHEHCDQLMMATTRTCPLGRASFGFH